MPRITKPMRRLQERINYQFQNPELLRQAVCHRSYLNENGSALPEHNERLEFLGDSVLNFLVAADLHGRYCGWDEGLLTKARAALVQAGTLAEVAREIELGESLLLGRGEETSNGRDKDSLLADALEALIAAVYLDGGLRKARTMVRQLMGHRLKDPESCSGMADPKSRLQEWTMRTYGVLPRYQLQKTEGPDHDRTFIIEVAVGKHTWGEGRGKSKKTAQQQAASEALKRIREVRVSE